MIWHHGCGFVICTNRQTHKPSAWIERLKIQLFCLFDHFLNNLNSCVFDHKYWSKHFKIKNKFHFVSFGCYIPECVAKLAKILLLLLSMTLRINRYPFHHKSNSLFEQLSHVYFRSFVWIIFSYNHEQISTIRLLIHCGKCKLFTTKNI